MLGTINGAKDAAAVSSLFKKWQPLIAIIAIPDYIKYDVRMGCFSTILLGLASEYNKRKIRLSHSAIGGVTNSVWHVLHLSRRSVLGALTKQALMMAPQFLRPLQTALQDTLGESALKSVKFEQASTAAPLSGSSITGYVSSEKRGFREPVYDSSGSAPDIGTLPRDNRNFWVAANSVYDPNRKVIRQVSTSELFTIWDYEGKLESKNWNPVTRGMVLNARLSSPPAKMIRSFVFTAGEILLSHSHTPPAVLKSHSALHTAGKSSDIPFNPMEDTTDTRVKAAQADDAEVDLSQWIGCHPR